MPPVKITLTAHFRALRDPVAEVREPIAQLKKWAVPQMLASDGLITNGIRSAGKNDVIGTIFPSFSPQVIAMRYGDLTYEPMVIESISEPFTTPRSEKGILGVCQPSCRVTSRDLL